MNTSKKEMKKKLVENTNMKLVSVSIRNVNLFCFSFSNSPKLANRRISHMPKRIEHFFSREKYRIAKDSLQSSKGKYPAWQEISEAVLKTELGWLSFPNYYMLSTIYHLLAPLATFKILQSRLTAVDLELDPAN